jgi:hypothetical protein
MAAKKRSSGDTIASLEGSNPTPRLQKNFIENLRKKRKEGLTGDFAT